MTWGQDPLDTIPNRPTEMAVWGQLMNQGFALTQQAVTAAQNIAALSASPYDLSGIVFNPLTPPSASLVVPTAPTALTITSPTIGVDPDDTAAINLLNDMTAGLWLRIDNDNIQAITYNRAVDNQTKLQSESYNNFLAATASDGFSSSGGQALAGAFIHFETEKNKALSGLNRDIAIFKFDADLKTYDALRGVATEYLSLLNTQEDILMKRPAMFNAINQILVDNQRTKTDGYRAVSEITIKQAELVYRQLDSVNAINNYQAQVQIEKAKIMNTYSLGYYQANVEAQKSVAGFMGQMAASSFNSIGLSESHGYQVHWNASISA